MNSIKNHLENMNDNYDMSHLYPPIPSTTRSAIILSQSEVPGGSASLFRSSPMIPPFRDPRTLILSNSYIRGEFGGEPIILGTSYIRHEFLVPYLEIDAFINSWTATHYPELEPSGFDHCLETFDLECHICTLQSNDNVFCKSCNQKWCVPCNDIILASSRKKCPFCRYPLMTKIPPLVDSVDSPDDEPFLNSVE